MGWTGRGDPGGVRRRRPRPSRASACWRRSSAPRWRRCRSRPRSISPARPSWPAAARSRRRPGCRSSPAARLSARSPWRRGPARPTCASCAPRCRGGALTGKKFAGARRRRRRRRRRRCPGRARRRARDRRSQRRGRQREAVETIDPSGRTRASFSTTRPPSRSAAPGDGEALLRRVHDRAAVLIAFEQVGGAQRSLEMARDYALQRYAFGRPIGSFQAIKHKLADVYVATELARSNAYYGAWALSRDAPELPLAAAAARISASEAFFLAAKENIQVHGGMGFTWEFDCHLYYRRAKLLSPCARQHQGVEGPPDHPARDGQRAALSARLRSEDRHGLRRHPRRSRIPRRRARLPRQQRQAPRAGRGHGLPRRQRRSGVPQAAPRPGRPRRPTPAMPASPGRRNGAAAAARPSSR